MTENDSQTRQFLQDVVAGLRRAGQKELQCSYLYDDLGSALFEAITYLPEYGLTRADERLLHLHSPALLPLCGATPHVVELGSGGGRKTRLILEALGASIRATLGDDPAAAAFKVTYSPIDISAAALSQCEKELLPYAHVLPIESSYMEGIAQASARRTAGQPLLVLFLGSTIGNFSRRAAAEFLRELRRQLRPGDVLLLGADLEKDEATMLLAYDDPTGVTAAFNRNLLGRINRVLGADFDLRAYRHQARWNAAERCVEMHLVATAPQRVRIAAADLCIDFAAGESIFTESSHKYHAAEVAELGRGAGFRCAAQWIDKEWPFLEAVFIATPGAG